MWACYELVHNFGWAIIIFTVIVKAAMLPLNIKQQKNTAISQLYAPRVREIQQKYKNNQQKQQEELTKLQKLGELLQLNSDASEYLFAQYALNNLVSEVYSKLGQAVGIDLSMFEA